MSNTKLNSVKKTVSKKSISKEQNNTTGISKIEVIKSEQDINSSIEQITNSIYQSKQNLQFDGNFSDVPLESLSGKELMEHPLLALIPKLSGIESDAIRRSIHAEGFSDAIYIDKSLNIIDGRFLWDTYNSGALDHKPKILMHNGTEQDVSQFILNRNYIRRNLTQGQKALFVVGFISKLKSADISIKLRLAELKDVNLDTLINFKSSNNQRDIIAELMGISSSFLAKANVVIKNAELTDKVLKDQISLEAAYMEINKSRESRVKKEYLHIDVPKPIAILQNFLIENELVSKNFSDKIQSVLRSNRNANPESKDLSVTTSFNKIYDKFIDKCKANLDDKKKKDVYAKALRYKKTAKDSVKPLNEMVEEFKNLFDKKVKSFVDEAYDAVFPKTTDLNSNDSLQKSVKDLYLKLKEFYDGE